MSDLVERLRVRYDQLTLSEDVATRDLICDAADEIERLRELIGYVRHLTFSERPLTAVDLIERATLGFQVVLNEPSDRPRTD